MKHLIILSLTLLLTATAFGQEDKPDVTLSDSKVREWTKALNALKDWSEEKGNELGSIEMPSGEEVSADDYVAALGIYQQKAAEYQAELDRIFKQHTFSGSDEWNLYGEKVMKTYGAIALQESNISESLQGIVKQMEAMGMSQEQIDEAKKQIASAEEAIDDAYSDVTDRDRTAVRNNWDFLQEAFGEKSKTSPKEK